MKDTVGIDEVGRGPLAGPVAVCAVQWLSEEDPAAVLDGIRDSKQMTPRSRAQWFSHVQTLSSYLRFSINLRSAQDIDTHGIAHSLATAAGSALNELHRRNRIAHVHADEGLQIPDCYAQTHSIRGDELNPLISLASVIAKVFRDDILCRYDVQFPQYQFAKNKGYGTAVHRDAIKQHGTVPIHRQTFLRNILQ
ncbi:MAG: ribonuclease HII [Candidatus Kaiserbacteria bacterium]|nr:ribonuclease HII [Candidatus Kaiserbacteria bacterium]